MLQKIHAEERFVGLGEKTGHLNRRQTAFSNWNTDYLGYPESARELYLRFLFIWVVMMGYGTVFSLTTAIEASLTSASNHRFAYFSAEAGLMDYYFIHGDSPAAILSEYKNLTGATPMPPKWAMGLQQCRYSYYPDTEFIRRKTYRKRTSLRCLVLRHSLWMHTRYLPGTRIHSLILNV